MDSDDDFGEFGGFEAAEVSSSTSDTQTDSQAAAPWALMAAAATGITQSSVQHSSEDNMTAHAKQQLTDIDDCIGVTNWASIGEELDANSAMFSQESNLDTCNEKQVSWAFQSTPDSSHEAPSITQINYQLLPDTNSSHSVSSQNQNPPKVSTGTDFDLDVDPMLTNAPNTAETSTKWLSKSSNEDTPQVKTEHFLLNEAHGSNDTVSSIAFKELQQLKEQQQKMKAELQKELDKLKEHNTDLEEQNALLHKELEMEKQNYVQLQQKHLGELESVRESGHKALSIIVEEYKELSKLAVLETQTQCQDVMKQALQSQAKKQEQLFHLQEEEFRKDLVSMEKELQISSEKSLQTIHEEYKKSIENVVLEQTEKSEEMMRKALQEQQKTHEEKMLEVLATERRNTERLVQEEKEKWAVQVEIIKNEATNDIKKAIRSEQENCQKCVQETLKAEQNKQRSLLERFQNEAKEEMKKYIAEQRNRDCSVRHRQLAAVDLFLDSARQQINLLLKPQDDTS